MPKKKDKQELTEEHKFIQILNDSYYKIDGRTAEDRHREFNNVFMQSDEGKRVLYEILSMAKVSARLVPKMPVPIDEKRLLVLEGSRQLALDIISVIQTPVNTDKPVKVNRRP